MIAVADDKKSEVIDVTTPEGTVVRCAADLARRIGWSPVVKKAPAKRSVSRKSSK